MSKSAEGAAPGPERAADGVSATWELETPIPEDDTKRRRNRIRRSDAEPAPKMVGRRCGMLSEEAAEN
jgi:hypothetical protein